MKNQTLKGLNRGIHKVGRGNIKLARNISYQKKKKKRRACQSIHDAQRLRCQIQNLKVATEGSSSL